ncbi:hypothetical protein DFH06DRAFT_1321857 [Mycena polygramma]|nr:hypothetical protein DFH06DRAFT_1321857 [Mycena polygramma]
MSICSSSSTCIRLRQAHARAHRKLKLATSPRWRKTTGPATFKSPTCSLGASRRHWLRAASASESRAQLSAGGAEPASSARERRVSMSRSQGARCTAAATRVIAGTRSPRAVYSRPSRHAPVSTRARERRRRRRSGVAAGVATFRCLAHAQTEAPRSCTGLAPRFFCVPGGSRRGCAWRRAADSEGEKNNRKKKEKEGGRRKRAGASLASLPPTSPHSTRARSLDAIGGGSLRRDAGGLYAC